MFNSLEEKISYDIQITFKDTPCPKKYTYPKKVDNSQTRYLEEDFLGIKTLAVALTNYNHIDKAWKFPRNIKYISLTQRASELQPVKVVASSADSRIRTWAVRPIAILLPGFES